ncbi:Cystathionine gamma-lyase [Paramyrothecium foliicola]|nr:Cystathionine gamma-lyase [Paramyrothecium foliicola]
MELKALTLIVCYLFICIENLMGRFEHALDHLRSGIKLIIEANEQSMDFKRGVYATSSQELILQVIEQFRHLDLRAVTFLADWTPQMPDDCDCNTSTLEPSLYFPPINSLSLAADQLEVLTTNVLLRSWGKGTELKSDGLTAAIHNFERLKRLLSQLESWSQSFEIFLLSNPGYMSISDQPLVQMLRLQHLVLSTLLAAYTPDWEMSYDAHLKEFNTIVMLARDLISSCPQSQVHNSELACFTLEVGIIPCLYLTGIKCRDPSVRREVLRILRQSRRREAAWDSISTARIIERVMEIEESGLKPNIFNEDALLSELSPLQKGLGAVPSPFDCWHARGGLRTLQLRIEACSKSAEAVALASACSDRVLSMSYSGLEFHKQHALVHEQNRDGLAGVPVSFRIRGGADAADGFCRWLRLFTDAVSLGGVESLAQIPNTLNHSNTPENSRLEGGIHEDLVRLSCGVEGTDDLVQGRHVDSDGAGHLFDVEQEVHDGVFNFFKDIRAQARFEHLVSGAATRGELVERDVSQAYKGNIFARVRHSLVPDELQKLLRCVMHQTYNVALLVDDDQSLAKRHQVPGGRNIILVNAALAQLNNKCMLQFRGGQGLTRTAYAAENRLGKVSSQEQADVIVYYTFEVAKNGFDIDYAALEKKQQQVQEIIREDTDVEAWPCTLSLIPICFPPPISNAAFEKIKDIEGVVVTMRSD